jgi:hypothetical protein
MAHTKLHWTIDLQPFFIFEEQVFCKQPSLDFICSWIRVSPPAAPVEMGALLLCLHFPWALLGLILMPRSGWTQEGKTLVSLSVSSWEGRHFATCAALFDRYKLSGLRGQKWYTPSMICVISNRWNQSSEQTRGAIKSRRCRRQEFIFPQPSQDNTPGPWFKSWGKSCFSFNLPDYSTGPRGHNDWPTFSCPLSALWQVKLLRPSGMSREYCLKRAPWKWPLDVLSSMAAPVYRRYEASPRRPSENDGLHSVSTNPHLCILHHAFFKNEKQWLDSAWWLSRLPQVIAV